MLPPGTFASLPWARRRDHKSNASGVRPRLGWGTVAVLFVSASALAGCGGTPNPSSVGGYPSFLPKRTLHPDVDANIGRHHGKARPYGRRPGGRRQDGRLERCHNRERAGRPRRGPALPGRRDDLHVDSGDARLDRAVPVSAADFHSVDHLGSVFVMGLVRGEAPPPRLLRAGQKLTFQLRAYELVGEGMMQWAPDHKHVVAYWDYTVEND